MEGVVLDLQVLKDLLGLPALQGRLALKAFQEQLPIQVRLDLRAPLVQQDLKVFLARLPVLDVPDPQDLKV